MEPFTFPGNFHTSKAIDDFPFFSKTIDECYDFFTSLLTNKDKQYFFKIWACPSTKHLSNDELTHTLAVSNAICFEVIEMYKEKTVISKNGWHEHGTGISWTHYVDGVRHHDTQAAIVSSPNDTNDGTFWYYYGEEATCIKNLPSEFNGLGSTIKMKDMHLNNLEYISDEYHKKVRKKAIEEGYSNDIGVVVEKLSDVFYYVLNGDNKLLYVFPSLLKE